jgi:hypothetical protein
VYLPTTFRSVRRECAKEQVMNFATATKYLSATGVCLAISCSDGTTTYTTPRVVMDDRDAAPSAASDAGLHRIGQDLVLETDPFTLEAGQEKYMCFTQKIPDAIKVHSYSKEKQPFLHHLVLATTVKEEAGGLQDCDATFQLNWRPLFAAGAGKVDFAFPPGVVNAIDSGAQILVQLHLLNTSDHRITDFAKLVMATTDEEQTQPVLLAVFGNTNINLPPGQSTSLVTDCQNPVTTRAVGFFPHMHMLGKSMTLEVGPDADSLQTLFRRDPYDFNDQAIDATDTMVTAGSHVRLTCNYDNTRQDTVTYGESSFDEMCFLMMFAVGAPTGCITGSVPLTQ